MPNICGKTEIAFVDPSVDFLPDLLAGLRDEVRAVVLDAGRPAAGQIARALDGCTADQVHIISHGGPGVVAFTGGALTQTSLNEFAEDLSAIGAALGNGGGLSLWSCRVAEGEPGSAFVAALARTAGVAVAASDQPVGSAAKGGTWTLTGGAHAAQPPLRAPALETYEGVMAIGLDFNADDGFLSEFPYNNEFTYAPGSVATVFDHIEVDTTGGTSGRVDRIVLDITAENTGERLFLTAGGLTWAAANGFTVTPYNTSTGQLILSKTNGSGSDWETLLSYVRFEDTIGTPQPGSIAVTATSFGTGFLGSNESDTAYISYDIGAPANTAPSTPTDTDSNVNTVVEGASANTTVGIDVNSTDTQTVTYSLTDSAGGRFQINSSTGIVTVANGSLINYTGPGSQYSITVQASDGSLTSSQTFVIQVTNADPSQPVDSNGPTGGTIAENSANNALVGITASSTDPAGGAVTYSLFDNAGGRFKIDATTGVVSVANGSLLNHEANDEHTIIVRASDAHGGYADRAFTIAVTDVDEAPDVTLSSTAVLEGQPVGTIVGKLLGVDPDDGAALTYQLLDDAGGRFAIQNGNIVTTVVLDYEDSSAYTIKVRVTDTGDNPDLSTDKLIGIQVLDPFKPVVSIDEEGPTRDTSPDITGISSQPNRTVNLYEAGVLIGSTVAGADGRWTINVPGPLTDGTRTFRAEIQDAAGNIGQDTMTFVVDTVAPVVTIDAGQGGPTNEDTVTLTGTAEAGLPVQIYDGATLLGEAVVSAPDGDGRVTWSFVLDVDGDHSIIAQQTDLAGNIGQSNGGDGVEIGDDTTPPPVAITSGDETTNDATPTISGTSEAGATIEIFEDGVSRGTTTADADGNWSIDSNVLSGDGDHDIYAVATDEAGNESEPSNSVTITLDETLPAVTITSGGGLTNDPTPTISGSATAGALVTVYDDGNVAGTVTAGADGAWSLDIALGNQGPSTITAIAEDEAGNDSPVSNAVTLSLDSVAPALDVTSAGGNVLQASQVVQGVAEAGSVVQLREGGVVVGSTVVGSNGQWSIAVNLGAIGSHTYAATARDAAGNVSSIDTVTFNLQLTPGQGGGFPDDFTVAEAFVNIMREPVAGDWVAYVEGLQDQVDEGDLSLEDAVNEIIDEADGSTSVATLAYQFFTGAVPTAAGLDFLVSEGGANPNSLNDPYYQNFNYDNRYINFAVNLGVLGEGADEFEAEYGDMTLFEATFTAYEEIFGLTPTANKINTILNAQITSNGESMTRAEYFALYGGDGLDGQGTKAAMVGWLLSEAAKSDTGEYAQVNELFLLDIADGGTYNVDIVGTYGGLIDG